MKTLLLALLAPERGPGTRLGALRGLIGVGKEAVRKGILDAGGAAERLREVLGDFFAERLVSDASWARGVLAET